MVDRKSAHYLFQARQACTHSTFHHIWTMEIRCFIEQRAYLMPYGVAMEQNLVVLPRNTTKRVRSGRSCTWSSRSDGWRSKLVLNSVRVGLHSCMGLFECSHVVFALNHSLSSESLVGWNEKWSSLRSHCAFSQSSKARVGIVAPWSSLRHYCAVAMAILHVIITGSALNNCTQKQACY